MTGPFVEFSLRGGGPVMVNLSRVSRFQSLELTGATEIFFDATDGLGGTDVEVVSVYVDESYVKVKQAISNALFVANTGEVWR